MLLEELKPVWRLAEVDSSFASAAIDRFTSDVGRGVVSGQREEDPEEPQVKTEPQSYGTKLSLDLLSPGSIKAVNDIDHASQTTQKLATLIFKDYPFQKQYLGKDVRKALTSDEQKVKDARSYLTLIPKVLCGMISTFMSEAAAYADGKPEAKQALKTALGEDSFQDYWEERKSFIIRDISNAEPNISQKVRDAIMTSTTAAGRIDFVEMFSTRITTLPAAYIEARVKVFNAAIDENNIEKAVSLITLMTHLFRAFLENWHQVDRLLEPELRAEE